MKLADRVKETTTSTGTGTINLAGAASSCEAFMDRFASGDEVFYYIAHQSADEWECGYGTITDGSPDTLSRNVIASSNSNALVNFSAGTKDVFNEVPARFVSRHIRTITGNTTLDDFDRFVVVNNTAAITITLPTAVGCNGRTLTFYKASGEFAATIDANGTQTIGGALTYVLVSPATSLTIVSDGVNWIVVGQPGERILQGFVATVDDTPANALDIPIDDGTAYLIEYKVISIAGSGGTSYWHRICIVRRTGGGPPSINLDSEYSVSTSGLDTVTAQVQGNNVAIECTGSLADTGTWHCLAKVTKITE